MSRPFLTKEKSKEFDAVLPFVYAAPSETPLVACFTGHRPNKLHGYDYKTPGNVEMLFALRDIIEYYIQHGVTTFVTGMALGIDMWAARLVLALKQKYPHIQLHAYVPCQRQYSKWLQESVDEWHSIIEQADLVHYVTDAPYDNGCMQRRNVAMVNASDLVIAVWDGTPGGTGNCVRSAKAKGRPIAKLDPKTYAFGTA